LELHDESAEQPKPERNNWLEASLHDLYPPQWPDPELHPHSNAARHQFEISEYRASVFNPSEIPLSPEQQQELLTFAGRAAYQYDELLLTGQIRDDERLQNVTERIFERAMVVSRGIPWAPEHADEQLITDNRAVFAILGSEEMASFLLPHYRTLQEVRGEEPLPGRLTLWESQFTRMGHTGRFQFIGKHDHSDIGDLVTVNLLKITLDWADHNKHGHVIEVRDAAGELAEMRVPAAVGDMIVEGAEVKHRVPKLKDRESRRISLASVWRFEASS
jgi:hypothetical protein